MGKFVLAESKNKLQKQIIEWCTGFGGIYETTLNHPTNKKSYLKLQVFTDTITLRDKLYFSFRFLFDKRVVGIVKDDSILWYEKEKELEKYQKRMS